MAGRDIDAPVPFDELTPENKQEIINWKQDRMNIMISLKEDILEINIPILLCKMMLIYFILLLTKYFNLEWNNLR